MKLMPAPLLSLMLLILWLTLQGRLNAPTLLVGAGVAVMVPLMTAPLRPTKVRIRRPALLLVLLWRLLKDVLYANAQIAWRVWCFQASPPQSQWVVIPLRVRAPAALATLAVIASMAPGTVWCELSMDRSRLLFHVFHVPPYEDFAARFTARYETLLLEIFE